MHTVAMREELWRESPWIAVSLFKAFQRAKELAYQRLNDLSPYKISLTWFREPVREQREILGDDPWAYGLAKEKVKVEELFAPNTLDL